MRDDFRDRINALTRPLLLDQPVDISTVVSTWKAVIESKHRDTPVPYQAISKAAMYIIGMERHGRASRRPIPATIANVRVISVVSTRLRPNQK